MNSQTKDHHRPLTPNSGLHKAAGQHGKAKQEMCPVLAETTKERWMNTWRNCSSGIALCSWFRFHPIFIHFPHSKVKHKFLIKLFFFNALKNRAFCECTYKHLLSCKAVSCDALKFLLGKQPLVQNSRVWKGNYWAEHDRQKVSQWGTESLSLFNAGPGINHRTLSHDSVHSS